MRNTVKTSLCTTSLAYSSHSVLSLERREHMFLNFAGLQSTVSYITSATILSLFRRQLLFTSVCNDRKISDHISGVILYHETFFQKADDGQSFVNKLKNMGIVPGIKVTSISYSISYRVSQEY